MDKKVILITCGDTAGIGPEVALRAVRAFETPPETAVLMVGPAAVWKNQGAALGLVPPSVTDANFNPADLPRVSVLDVPSSGTVEPGNPSEHSAKDAMNALETACDLIKSGRGHALVTMPVSKAQIRSTGAPFYGHTEFLAEKFNARTTMMLACSQMRFFLVTTHLAFRDVPKVLTVEKVLDTIRLTATYTSAFTGKPAPRLGLAALNPHASDSGAFGDEEEKILIPAAKAARSEGIDVEGPIPADTLARRMKYGEFDAAVALFHDQALIPLKMLDPMHGVNVTFGLPFPRTSPLHGTGFDISGLTAADWWSALESLKTALYLLRKK
jgi:4-hydroxythreonine-4-phosphate dehydrogenase